MTGDHGQPRLYIVQRRNREPARQRPLVLDHLVELVEISGREDMGKDFDLSYFSRENRLSMRYRHRLALGFGHLASSRAGKDGVALVVIDSF